MSLKDLYNKVKSLWETVPEIVTSGSNANGDWTKFSDGTLICRGAFVATNISWTAVGSIYRSNHQTITIPLQYDDTGYAISGIVRVDDDFSFSFGNIRQPTKTDFEGVIVGATNTRTEMEIRWTAVGRWK